MPQRLFDGSICRNSQGHEISQVKIASIQMYDPSLSLLSLLFIFQRFDPLLQCSVYGRLKDRLTSCLLLKNLDLHPSICDKTIGGDLMIQVSHSVDTRIRLLLVPQDIETAFKHHP